MKHLVPSTVWHLVRKCVTFPFVLQELHWMLTYQNWQKFANSESNSIFNDYYHVWRRQLNTRQARVWILWRKVGVQDHKNGGLRLTPIAIFQLLHLSLQGTKARPDEGEETVLNFGECDSRKQNCYARSHRNLWKGSIKDSVKNPPTSKLFLSVTKCLAT